MASLRRTSALLQLSLLCLVSSLQSSPAEIALPDDSALTEIDRQFMKRAYELAGEAVDNGNHPFGALIVKDGKVLLEYRNRVVTDHDVTEHAETGLVRLASRVIPPEDLEGHTLYTSTEPCIMCCGAIYWLGSVRLVYGTSATGLSELSGGAYKPIPSKEVFARMSPETAVVGPCEELYGLEQHAAFWPDFIARQAAKGE